MSRTNLPKDNNLSFFDQSFEEHLEQSDEPTSPVVNHRNPPSLDNSFTGDIEEHDDETLDIDEMPRVSKRFNLTKGLKEKVD